MIKEELQNIFKEIFEHDSIVLKDDMTAEHINEWDSLTHIQLIESIETKFGISFTLQEVMGLENVGEFIDLTKQKTGEKL